MRKFWAPGAASEGGAALIEFALIFPIFMTVVLGMFTGGISYNRKINLTNASREASRYGATLPISNFSAPAIDNWLDSVADSAEQNASGELGTSVTGRSICVTYVSTGSPSTRRLIRTNGADAFVSGANCFSDNRPNDEKRVQVRLTRPSKINGLFFTINLTLASNSLTRFEAAAP